MHVWHGLNRVRSRPVARPPAFGLSFGAVECVCREYVAHCAKQSRIDRVAYGLSGLLLRWMARSMTSDKDPEGPRRFIPRVVPASGGGTRRFVDPTTDDERARLAYLWSCDLLYTEPEPRFDEIVRVAARACRAPAAAISLVDADRVWVKAGVGLDISEWHREGAFCADVVASRKPVVVRDARTDATLDSRACIEGPADIRSYAGWPLITSSGAILGSLCVLDVNPRGWRADRLEFMAVLARQVVAQIELRRASAELTRMWQRQRDLERQCGDARDNKQGTMAVELTEGLAQDLAGISFLVQACRQSVGKGAAGQLESVSRLLRNSMHRCITLARGDLAWVFDHSSLRDSLHRYVAHMSAITRFACSLDWSDTVDLQDRTVAYGLFRIAQEAVTNAVRHSGGLNVAVTVHVFDGRLCLDVTDDGCGLPRKVHASDGVGLAMIRLRASAIGGVIELSRARPRGLSVRCSVLMPSRPQTPRL